MLNFNHEDLYGKTRCAKVRSILFVDPGLEGTGLARWYDFCNSLEDSLPLPFDTKAIVPRGALTWRQKFRYVMAEFSLYVAACPVDRVVIESQSVWAGSAKSIASVSKGNLLKLVMLTGAMMRVCDDNDKRVTLVAPTTWKGQLSKAAVHKRIKLAMQMRFPEHVADAVGMALSAMGQL